ncbi:MAG: hypothetical protein KAQ96_12130, partial [Thermoplasmata archaeon]|nr:hypothetical protein [Thermoplasmata archaeon]
GTWAASYLVSGTIQRLNYMFYAKDDFGNIAMDQPQFVLIQDITQPKVEDFTGNLSGSATTGELFAFWANISDNIGIAQVQVHYMAGSPRWLDQNVTMDPMSVDGRGNGIYILNITTYSNSTATLEFSLMAWDTSNNFKLIRTQAPVLDNDWPEFKGDQSNVSATTGDEFNFIVDVEDNVAIEKVKVLWTYGALTPLNQTMKKLQVDSNGNGKYRLNVSLPSDFEGNMWYQFIVEDNSRLKNVSKRVNLEIIDNDAPVVGPDGSAAVGEERYDFLVNVTDNIGVDSVWVEYFFLGEASFNITMVPIIVDDGGNGTYGNVVVPIPLDRQVYLDYVIGAIDLRGYVSILEGEYENVDSERPFFGANGSTDEPIKGKSIGVYIEADDNFGINEVDVEYWFGTAAPRNDTMTDMGDTFNFTIHIPRNPTGDLFYRFHAVDMKGNWNSTIEWTLTPYNVAPQIGDMPPWEITESENEVLDLQTFLIDVNDPVTSLTLEVDAPDITVSGLRLLARYDVWLPDHTIQVIVSDGEDAATLDVEITVINVNDLPMFTSSPVKTAEVTIPYEYEITFTDEDVGESHSFDFDDNPEGMEVDENGLITWTPTGDQEGAHTVDLALDDGHNVVHQQWTITVSERTSDGPPVFTNSPPLTHAAGEDYTFDFEAEDPDGDPVVFKLLEGPDDAEISETGVLTWDPKANKRDTTDNVDFVVRVSDLRNNVDKEFTVALSYPDNAPPEITGSIPKVTTDRDRSVNLGDYMSDPDDEKNTLKWNANTTSNIVTVHMNGNHLVISIREGKSGKATVELTLSDPWDESDSVDLTIEVEASDDDGGALGIDPLYLAIIVVVVIVVLGLVYILRGGSKK